MKKNIIGKVILTVIGVGAAALGVVGLCKKGDNDEDVCETEVTEEDTYEGFDSEDVESEE